MELIDKLALTWVAVYVVIYLAGVLEIFFSETDYRWWAAGVWFLAGLALIMVKVWC